MEKISEEFAKELLYSNQHYICSPNGMEDFIEQWKQKGYIKILDNKSKEK